VDRHSTLGRSRTPHVTFNDRFFEALVLLLADEDRQLVSLDIKTWVGDDDVSGENADRLPESKTVWSA
jgi:hypothetical protein